MILLLLAKLVPLYVLIGLGFIAGKKLKLEASPIGTLLIYVLSPAVVFFSVSKTQLDPSRLMLPIVFFALCALLGTLGLFFSRLIYKDATPQILGFMAGSANTGYFGLPVVSALFGPEGVGITLLAIFGLILFENSLGFYFAARGRFGVKESFKKLIRLPSLYAFGAALVLSLYGGPFQWPEAWENLGASFRGAYTVLGMMLIGLGLSVLNSKRARDLKFPAFALSMKFVAWPLVMAAFLAVFGNAFHPMDQKILRLMSFMPLPANSVALAVMFKNSPDKVAEAVWISTLIALVLIPVLFS